MKLALTRKLYSVITSTTLPSARLQFVPGNDVDILCHEEDCCDVGLSKKTYLAVFKEGHDHIEDLVQNYSQLCTTDELWNAYYVTIALLTTTNEHMMAWQIHREVVWALYRSEGPSFLHNEATYFMALATSRFQRINKSLVLFLWLRKLLVLGAFGEVNERTLNRVMEQVLRSMEAHFCNYAAGFMGVWLIEVARENSISLGAMLNMIKDCCMRNVADISLWTLMGTVLLGKTNVYMKRDWDRIISELSESDSIDQIPSVVASCGGDFKSSQLSDIANELLTWLLTIESPHKTPYLQLLRNGVPDSFPAQVQMKLSSSVSEPFKRTLATLQKTYKFS